VAGFDTIGVVDFSTGQTRFGGARGELACGASLQAVAPPLGGAAAPDRGVTVAGVGGAIAHSCLGHPSRAVELTLRKYDIVDGLDTVGKRGVVGVTSASWAR